MDDNAVQKKLDQLTKIANELSDEAARRWPEGFLFFEAEGSFHMMSRDSDDGIHARQEGIEFSSAGYCKMSAGAW